MKNRYLRLSLYFTFVPILYATTINFVTCAWERDELSYLSQLNPKWSKNFALGIAYENHAEASKQGLLRKLFCGDLGRMLADRDYIRQMKTREI